jgi:hypothetical protein
MVEHGHGYHVHTYTAGEAGLFVNSYLVESAEGVVLVDASLRSHADSYLTLDDRAFIGDLAFPGTHPYTADGNTRAWLAALDALTDALRDARLYPGHGAPGEVGMLAGQRRYLLMYRQSVARLAAGAPTLTDAQREDLTAVMTSFLPQAPLTWMIGLGADAVAAELVAEAVAA